MYKQRIITCLLIISISPLIQADNNETSTELSAYYGFNEIEIIKLDPGIMCHIIADFNGDGLNDIAIANNRKSKIEILLQKDDSKPSNVSEPDPSSINELPDTSLFLQRELLVTVKISSLVSGDFNSDGLVDLAFYGEPKGLYVMLQKTRSEGKTYEISWQPRKKISIDDGLMGTESLASGDLNGDNRDDLVLAGKDVIYVISQTQNGQLTEPVKYSTIAQPLSIMLGDINGDKRKDMMMLVSDAEKSLHVRFALETGQLSPLIQFDIDQPAALTVSDINDDNCDEILSIEKASSRLNGYKLSKTIAQKDNFASSVTYPLQITKESKKRDMVIGDFDGDGLADIVVSNPDSAEISLYRQIEKIGLTEPVNFPALSDITIMNACNTDQDIQDELVILSIKEKMIGISKYSNGRFSFPDSLDTIGEPVAMKFMDMDSNQKMDCVYISRSEDDIRSLRILYNACEGQQSEELIEVKLENLLSNPDGIQVLDVDQDGLLDVLVFQEYENPILLRQESKDKFIIIDSAASQGSLLEKAAVRSTTINDINGDGKLELIIAQRNFARSLLLAEEQKWRVIDQYNAKNLEDNISSLDTCDIDNDTVPEILLLEGQKGKLQILKKAEDGTYRFERQLDIGQWSTVNNLKILFARLTGSDSSSIVLFDGNKFALVNPSFDTEDTYSYEVDSLFSYETKIKDGGYARLIAGDINSDGREDIVTIEHKKNHIEILALDKTSGILKPVSAMKFKIFEEKDFQDGQRRSVAEPREMTIADVTGDGAADLVTIIHDRIIIYPQDI